MSTTPTPHSDQAATTPGRAEELAHKIVNRFEGHFREWMMPGEHAEAVEITKEVIEEYLRAQNAELLALRADKARLDWLEESTKLRCLHLYCQPKCGIMETDEFRLHANGIGWVGIRPTIRQAIDAALNSPPRKEQNEKHLRYTSR